MAQNKNKLPMHIYVTLYYELHRITIKLNNIIGCYVSSHNKQKIVLFMSWNNFLYTANWETHLPYIFYSTCWSFSTHLSTLAHQRSTTITRSTHNYVYETNEATISSSSHYCYWIIAVVARIHCATTTVIKFLG